ncbi:AP-3 complex subunit beta-2 [Thecamonas trahens ATCC 50062]|uniref:AP-3 complex subunit beta-2 n=1 Tax=Thecamonas trahens ATCC 50062 TaxID=461836 RepID=A0A0L0DU16_THETB|nr:AP-3 complex subunit beta-2 [Thecamonas trahens ATCC 50062]KNC55687.1 AP-3 complex subunit beta-2 [Thecamonas trahens ATCC 50062]|eukprot:XP_013761454.1 AP-3 complex subunit beta-2 [Thecamonas trahens ATCC 50062]
MIETLLNDSSTLVLGSAVNAFNVVCPTKYELIHPQYLKLCTLLVDCDEWGQTMILNMLVRYIRTQFLNPNGATTEEDADNDDGWGASGLAQDLDSFYAEDVTTAPDGAVKEYYMHADHRAVLRGAQSLLQSRNASVVMSVAMLFFHSAPRSDVGIAGKALIRLVRSHREVQYVVLSNIATMASKRPSMFLGSLKEFFVKSGDPMYVRKLKLEIITQLASESNISAILHELKQYVRSGEVSFVTESIQAVGRCAMRVPEVTESCLEGLISLLHSKSDLVVAESVVVIKKLLQLRAVAEPTVSALTASEVATVQSGALDDIIKHLIYLLDKISIASARACIVWVIGEYASRVPEYAPDVERKLAKSFAAEDEVTKLQILNMAAKLFLANPNQTAKLFEYILALGKYDANYDVRDRVRFMTAVLAKRETPLFAAAAKRLFHAPKPAPRVVSPYASRAAFVIGSLSHLVGHATPAYLPLPEWTLEEPDHSLRTPAAPLQAPSARGFGSSGFGGFGPDDYAAAHGVPSMQQAQTPAFGGVVGAAGDMSLDAFYADDGEYDYYSDDDAAPGAAPGMPGAAAPVGGNYGFYGAATGADDDYYDYYDDDVPGASATPAPASAKPSRTSNLLDLGYSATGSAAAPASAAPAASLPAAPAGDDEYYDYYDDEVAATAPTFVAAGSGLLGNVNNSSGSLL